PRDRCAATRRPGTHRRVGGAGGARPGLADAAHARRDGRERLGRSYREPRDLRAARPPGGAGNLRVPIETLTPRRVATRPGAARVPFRDLTRMNDTSVISRNVTAGVAR